MSQEKKADYLEVEKYFLNKTQKHFKRLINNSDSDFIKNKHFSSSKDTVKKVKIYNKNWQDICSI